MRIPCLVCQIRGTGTVLLQTSVGKLLELENVLYVPNMVKHLISVSRLLEKGNYDIKFNSCSCDITEKSSRARVGEADLCERLYRRKLNQKLQGTANVTSQASKGHGLNIMLWHARLNHINEQKLKITSSHPDLYRHPISGISNLEFCDSCAKEDQKDTLLEAVKLSCQATVGVGPH